MGGNDAAHCPGGDEPVTSYRSLVLLVLLVTPASRALCAAPMCSCAGGPGEFLIPTGAEIPADSRGIPFSGRGHVDWVGDRMQLVNTDLFTVDRLQDGRWVRLRADVELLAGPMIADGANHEFDRLILVSPVGGFVRGSQYLFSHYPTYDWHDPQPRKVVVLVSELSFAELVAEEPPSLVVGEAVREAMSVETRGGSCSAEIDAAAVPLRIELPTRLRRWQDVLLFSVVIDGEQIWRPQTSLCADVPPGHSWRGRARELLFADCGAPGEGIRRFSNPHDGLEQGFHRVDMSAWWPGIEARAVAAAVVELSCDAPDASSDQRE